MLRWDVAQVTIGADGLPMPRRSCALRGASGSVDVAAATSRASAGKRADTAGAAKLQGGGGPPPSSSKVAAVDVDERGGAKALAAMAKGGGKSADWAAVLTRVHGVGLCANCEAVCRESAGGGLARKCEEHGPPTDTGGNDSPGRESPLSGLSWWQGVVCDSGQALLDRKSLIAHRNSIAGAESAWRHEWKALRAEQLRLQGEEHGASDARLMPGRPESIEFLSAEFNSQISTLQRLHG